MDTIIFSDWDNYTLNGIPKVMDWNNVRRLPFAIPLTALTSALQERVDIVREFYRNSFDIPISVPVPAPLISLRNYCLKTNYVYNPSTIPDLLQALSPFFIDAGEDIVAIKSKIETITGIPYIEEQLFTPITKELFNQWRVWMGLLDRIIVTNRTPYGIINLNFLNKSGQGLNAIDAENSFISNTWFVSQGNGNAKEIGVWTIASNPPSWSGFQVQRNGIKDVPRSISINASKSIIITPHRKIYYNFPSNSTAYENPDTSTAEDTETIYLNKPAGDISLASNIMDTTLDYNTIFPSWVTGSINGFTSFGGEWGATIPLNAGSWKLIYDFNVPNGFKFV